MEVPDEREGRSRSDGMWLRYGAYYRVDSGMVLLGIGIAMKKVSNGKCGQNESS